MRKKNAFVAKNVNTRLTKIFTAIFAPDERLPSSATLELIVYNLLALELALSGKQRSLKVGCNVAAELSLGNLSRLALVILWETLAG